MGARKSSTGGTDADTTLEGHFLIAMPGMSEESPFEGSLVYLCAHSAKGAMGFIVNKPQDVAFSTILTQLGIIAGSDTIRLPGEGGDVPVCRGGPVETGRGFVLHSADYETEATVRMNEGLALTSTLDVLQAIAHGSGPRTALMTLGYAGWSPGQLEAEIAADGWLTCPADTDIVFDADHGGKYDRAIRLLGIDPAYLATASGHA